jgi:16S rRNA G966 N2-methylase RsmD
MSRTDARQNGGGNRLFFGDNLTVLREHVKDESVDLIYLDPPFNSEANYKQKSGAQRPMKAIEIAPKLKRTVGAVYARAKVLQRIRVLSDRD